MINDEARKRNENLPGMGGIFNTVNLHLYHYAGNNPVKYVDPDGRQAEITAEVAVEVVIVVAVVVVATVNLIKNAIKKTAEIFSRPNTAPISASQTNQEETIPEADRNAKKPDKLLPNQGTVTGDVEGAPSVNAGKQGKHVPGHNSYDPSESQWPEGQNGVNETQEAWLKGKPASNNTRVWDTEKPVGVNGETGVRVHIDKKGNIHGYPVDPNRYLK